jgi:NAD-dependent DNA ligase
MSDISVSTIINIPGFSNKLAKQLSNGLVTVNNYLLNSPTINEHFKRGIQKKLSESTNIIETDKLKNINIVFTGVRNKELEKKIINGGGKVSNNVNKSTTYLVTADNINNTEKKSAKEKKAQELSIKIINLSKFLTLIY